MPLTPEDVRSKQFTPVRLREGYDVTEVDAFLDEVEAELERLLAENEELRAKLAAAQRAGGSMERPDGPGYAAVQPKMDKIEEPKPGPAAEPPPVPASSVGDASSSAVRLLEMATKHADDLVQEAKD